MMAFIAQALAFRQGVEDFFPAHFLKLFTAEELQRDICGVGDHVDNWSESDVRKLFKLDGTFVSFLVCFASTCYWQIVD